MFSLPELKVIILSQSINLMTRHVGKNCKNKEEGFVVFMESLRQNYICFHVF